jgi:hypothetical protein
MLEICRKEFGLRKPQKMSQNLEEEYSSDEEIKVTHPEMK